MYDHMAIQRPEMSVRMQNTSDFINFLLTNYLPRSAATRFMGWFSKIESPLITRFSLGLWQLFADDLKLAEARKSTFSSLHDCFIRELKPGARPLTTDPNTLVSPCDAIIGAHGRIHGNQLLQIKGSPYTLEELLPIDGLADDYSGGHYVTLRLKSSMYHHMHAPADCRVTELDYISGDTWNVNPPTLRRLQKVFCKNERVALPLETQWLDTSLMLVPVAAILVASIRLYCLPIPLNLAYRGPNHFTFNAIYCRGDDMGYFEHGSTIIMLCKGPWVFCPQIQEGREIQMGEALLRRQDIDGDHEPAINATSVTLTS
ncbi:MAG: archaetidylserine decarboxylase [Proteobacteria bacterium]|nr:archaetidylserine decarboxylase [Pseudomonadota bacterium]